MIILKNKPSFSKLYPGISGKFQQRFRLGMITLIASLIFSTLPTLSFGQGEPWLAKGGYDVTNVSYKNPAYNNRASGHIFYYKDKMWKVKFQAKFNGVEDDGFYKEVKRDLWSVYLEKVNGNETRKIQIDLFRKKVMLSDIIKETKPHNDGTIKIESETTEELGNITSAKGEEIEVIEDELLASSTYHLTKPVTDKELDEVMRWIGRELSRSEVDFCWKDTYGRGSGYTTQSACEASDEAAGVGGKCEKYLALWYPVCKPGYQADGCCICSWRCSYTLQRAQINNCGAGCAENENECAKAVIDMVFAPIYMALNIASFGLAGAAKNTAKKALQQGANVATGGAAAVTNGVTKAALQKNWSPLLNALWKAEKYVDKVIEAKDKIEYASQNVENFATELERWNTHYADNFAEYTNLRINNLIDQNFPSDADRLYIKRRFGQYMLTAMLESDGWRIAKNILSVASIEPIGIVATVDAFAHPICKTEANPFPSIHIIPSDKRVRRASIITPEREAGKVYKKVYFHSQSSLSLAEALSIAKQNSWVLATATEVQEAWLFHKLDANAFGRMADGRFAIPIQTDHTNFKKGPNIGVFGKNQGFFYIKLNDDPPVFPPLNNGYVRIRNKSGNAYIHNQNGKPESGQIVASLLSAQWKIVKYAGQSVNIQSRSNPNLLLNNNNGRLEVVNIAKNHASALWELRPSNDRGWVRLQNSLNTNHYIYVKDGKLQLGPIQGNQSTALWKLE